MVFGVARLHRQHYCWRNSAHVCNYSQQSYICKSSPIILISKNKIHRLFYVVDIFKAFSDCSYESRKSKIELFAAMFVVCGVANFFANIVKVRYSHLAFVGCVAVLII